MTRERRADVVALVALVALTAIVFFPALSGDLFDLRDFPRWTWPSRELWKQAVLAGRLPQWNPYVGLGVPTLAVPVHGTFYPFHVLLLVMSLGAVFTLHAAWAGAGGYVLARFLKCRPTAAFVAGAVFAIGGYAVSMWGNGEKVLSCAWIPWSALAIAWALETLDKRRIALAAIPLAMIALAGDPFLWLHAVVLGLALTEPRKWWALAPIGGLAALLAAPALVPAIAMIGDTERTSLRAEAGYWSMHPVRLLELAAPNLLGDPYDMTRYPGARFVHEPALGATPWALSLYAGAAAVLFAPFGKRRGLFIAAAIGVLLALGKYIHVLVPLMRYPEKHAYLLIASLALLAALGCERALAGEVSLRRLSIPLLVLPIPLLARLPAAMAIAQCAVVMLVLLGIVYVRKLEAMIAVAVAADLFVAAVPLLRFTALVEAPQNAKIIRGAPSIYPPRVYRPRFDGDLNTLPDNLGIIYGIAHIPGHDAALPRALHEYWDHAAGEEAMSRLAIDWMITPQGAAVRWPTPQRLSPGCNFARYQPESIAIECEGPRRMVLADQLARGWTATIDGTPATIEPEANLLRAVSVPPGHHRIEMRYRAPGLTLGLIGGALGMVLSALLIARRKTEA
jgi:hypothetical protein